MAAQFPDTARCLGCGYLLRGLPDALCPECGAPFDPADESSYADPTRPKPRGALRPLRPIGAIRLLIVSVVAVLIIAKRSTPRGVFVLFDETLSTQADRILECAIVVLFADAFLRVLAIRRYRRAGDPALLARFHRHMGRWRFYWIAQAIVLGTILHPWPAVLCMYPSLPAFSAAAEDYLKNANAREIDRSIGGHHVEYIWGRERGFVWFQLSHDLGGRYGLVWHSADSAELSKPRYRVWITPSWCFETW